MVIVVRTSIGLDGVVGIATRYGLDGRGSNMDGGKIYRTRLDRFGGLHSLL